MTSKPIPRCVAIWNEYEPHCDSVELAEAMFQLARETEIELNEAKAEIERLRISIASTKWMILD